jgi:DNA-binding transcriptional ArsR family regulator
LTRAGAVGKFNQVVEQVFELDAVFGALADPTRRAILARLREGEASVSELAEPFPVSLQAVSKHLRVLEEAGLVARRIDGRTHRLRLAEASLDQTSDWLDEQRSFWNGSVDELESRLGRRPRGRRGGLPQGSRR